MYTPKLYSGLTIQSMKKRLSLTTALYHLIPSSTNLYWPNTSQYCHILTQYHQVPLIIHHLVRHSSANWIISHFTTTLMSHAQYTWSSYNMIFQKRGRGRQRAFGTFRKIRPFWYPRPFLSCKKVKISWISQNLLSCSLVRVGVGCLSCCRASCHPATAAVCSL